MNITKTNSRRLTLEPHETELLIFCVSNEIINGFPVELEQIVGISKEALTAMTKELRERSTKEDVTLSRDEASVYSRGLAVVIQELGLDEFQTRTGYNLEWAKAVLSTLEKFVKLDKDLQTSAPAVSPDEIAVLYLLLQRSSLSQAPAAIAALPNCEFLVGGENDLKSLFHTYRIRGLIAQERGSRTEGWTELISGLGSELELNPTANARLYFGTSARTDLTVFIFTDSKPSKVLGILANDASSQRQSQPHINKKPELIIH